LKREYDFLTIKMFTLATLVWAVVGMSIGVYAAAELAFPALNMGIPYISFGRLKPVHVTVVVFAFGGCALFATSYYSVQRTCQVRLFSDLLSKVTFWGWNLIMVLAVITIPLGFTTGKEYAELEWPIDILVCIVWISYGVNYIGTVAKRKVSHIYVSNWFYMSMIISITFLYVINNLEIPVSFTKSYSVFSGVQDAMIQWWYGHNAVGLFLTAGFLGMMYYFLPKQAGMPVYSYRLSILHFWSLIFIYIWAGPHHLHYTALPDWTQTLGMTFSIMLLIPSWGGAVNGIMTVSGRWDKVKNDTILKFMITAMFFYALSTFEGSMMAIKTVNRLSHYTDWTIGHVHSGALGWVGFITIGSLYHLVSNLWKKKIYSKALVDAHYWLALTGVIIYMVAMWISGVSQGLMWRKTDQFGNLVYSFAETVAAIHPWYVMRMIGGILFLSGMIVMVVNVSLTIVKGKPNADS
jgi:cytochrome c oxidase cbb3-type subunit 1